MLRIGPVSSRTISDETLDPHVSAGGLPCVVLLERPRADGAGDWGLVRDYADDIGAAFDLFVQARDGVGCMRLGAVLPGKGHIGESIVLALSHDECGQLRPPRAQPIGHLTPHLTGGRAVRPIESLSEHGDRDAVPTP